MDTATAGTLPPRPSAFEDGLGKRHQGVGPGGEPLEVLEFRDEFSKNASFESALRERLSAFAAFQNASFARVRRVQRLGQDGSKLIVVSDRVAGVRLSTLLADAARWQMPIEANAALCLVHQLVAAIAMLHEKVPSAAHGALSPERLVITPRALVIVDYIAGSALEQQRHAPDRYWRELRIPLPPATEAVFDQRADVFQAGMVVLALLLGRAIGADEYPYRLQALVDRVCAPTVVNGAGTLPPEFRAWLMRMLQLRHDEAFASGAEAWAGLNRVLGIGDHVAPASALESFMAEYARRGASHATASSPAMALSAVASEGVQQASAPAAPKVIPFVAASTHAHASGQLETLAKFPPSTLSLPLLNADHPTVPAVESQAALSELMPQDARSAPANPTRRRRWVAVAAVVVAAAAAGIVGRQYLRPAAVAEARGTLAVSTNPVGIPVVVDGQPRGVTPLTLELPAGPHELKLAAEGEARIIPLTIAAGSTVSHTIELVKTSLPTGQVSVRSEPSGARVMIDGVPMGTTPLTIDGLVPGTHTVALTTELGSVTQEIKIDAGTMASLVVPMAAPQGVPVSGWISVDAPADVQVYEGGRLLGSSQSDRIMVSAGAHELDIVNDLLEYRVKRSVSVSPGKVSTIKLEWPKGTLALNAEPWAEVWIDGKSAGETPIGKITLPIGTHGVTFRHPQLGERVVRATVTATTPARVSVDMSKR
jgi:hypothetical protein